MSNPQILANRTVLSTRPEAAENGELETRLAAMGARVLCLPMLKIRPRPFLFPETLAFDWLFFTSRQAVKAFYGEAVSAGLQTLPVACVGPVTAEALTCFGLQASFVSPQFDALSAAGAFAKQYAGQVKNVLWPCGNRANPELPDVLEGAGMRVMPLLVYETHIRLSFTPEEMEILQQAPDLIIFTSPSAVQGFDQLRRHAGLDNGAYRIACLGPTTAQEAAQLLGRSDIQAKPSTLEGLAEAIRRAYTGMPC
jgi:uroporphyrinogen-III synthase